MEFRRNPKLRAELEDQPEYRELLQRAADFGADFWEANSRRKTGLMARQVEAYVEEGPDGRPHGVVHATVHYAPFQEFGTRYITGQHVLAALIPVLEAEFGR